MFVKRKENRHHPDRGLGGGLEAGNVFLAIFGAIALVGLLGAAVMTFMKGPLATSVRLTKMNTAENQMQIGSQVAVMATANQANSGDCDSDGYVEPIEWRAATTEPHPVNGGLVPLSLGISKKDPWGTEYGYCVWNHGATTSGSGCNANMLGGTASMAYPVVALISAGPDKTFTTTCRDFATADVNSNGNLADATDLPLVSKAAETDDDIITSFTYQEATGASGGLWNIKAGTPQTATIGKNIETTGSAKIGGGLLLPDKALVNCDATSAGVMAMNGNAIEMCNGTSWVPITGGSSKLDDQTVQTDLMCNTAATGQLRYNTNGGSNGTITFVGSSTAHNGGNGGQSSLTISNPLPSGTVAGDVLLYMYASATCGTTTWPAGFTEIATEVIYPECFSVAYKIATGTETNLDITNSSTYSLSGTVVVYAGVDTSSPINVSSSFQDSSGYFTRPWNIASTPITTTVNNARLVWFAAGRMDHTTVADCTTPTVTYEPPAGFTERVDIQSMAQPSACFNALTIADKVQATAGSTGVITGTATSGSPYGDTIPGSILVALKPASGGGGGGGTAPAIVQQTSADYRNPTRIFSAAPTTGNSIIALVSGNGDGTNFCDLENATTISDNYGNTYTKAVASNFTNVWAMNVGIWIAPVTSTGSNFTVTFANSSCADWYTLQTIEASGINNSSPVDVSAFAGSGYEKTLTVTTPSTTSANAIAFGVYDQPAGYGTMSASPEWTLIPGGATASATYNIYQILSSTGVVSNTWTADNDAVKPAAIAVFKGSGSGGGSGIKKVEVCNGTSWAQVGSTSSPNPTPSTAPIKLGTEAVNTDLMCNGTNLGLMRYNTNGTSTTDSVTKSSGGISPTIVQSIPFGNSSFNSPPTVGNSIVLLVSGESGGDWWDTQSCNVAGATVTDNMGNIYTKVAASDSHDDGSANSNSAIWIAPVVNTGAGFTPTVTAKTYTGIDCGWVIPQFLELSGVDNASPVDVHASYSDSNWDGSSLTVSTPSATITNGLALGVFDHRTGFSSMSLSSGWTALPETNTFGDYNISKPVNSTGVVSNTWTPDAHAQMSGSIAVFKGTSGGGGTTTTTVTDSTYAQVCNGTEWLTLGSGFLDNLNDAVTNYTTTAASGKQSTSSMFFGKDVGMTATSGAANNTAIGVGSMAALTTGGWNTAFGMGSLASNTTGDDSTAVGMYTLYTNTTGAYNTAVGSLSLARNTTGYNNSTNGMYSLNNNTIGSNNVANGMQALYSNIDGAHNTANGAGSLYSNTSGWANTANGSDALALNTTGIQNTAVGVEALNANTTPCCNSAVGYQALNANTTGEFNTALGYQAGAAGTGNTTGTYNTFIGYQAQANADNYTNSTALGNGAIITGSNQIILGNASIAQIRAKVTSITAISDRRMKKDIESSELGLFFIDSLRPVQYRYNNGDNTLRYGFIAQETESVLPDHLKPLVGKESGLALVNHDNDRNQTYHMTYGELTAPIVKAIQELNAKFTAFMKELEKAFADIWNDEKKQDEDLKKLHAELDALKLAYEKK